MKIHALKTVLILIFVTNVYAQDPVLKRLDSTFQQFQFDQVIFLADSILISMPQLSPVDKIEALRLKGISWLSKGHPQHSELAFKSILKIDPGYQMQSGINAPKVLQLFNEIKSNYSPVSAPVDSQFHEQKVPQYNNFSPVGRSLIFPGWGHHFAGKAHGKAYMAGSALLIPLTIWFSATTWQYEQDYLKQTNEAKIRDRYDIYDKHYKIRNILLSTYLVYWLYAQYDFFSAPQINQTGATLSIMREEKTICLGLNYSF